MTYFFIILVIFVGWGLFVWFGVDKVAAKIDGKSETTKKEWTNVKETNDPEVGFAAVLIDATAKFVKEKLYLLECNKITMWETNDGYRVEFYGFERFCKGIIEKELDDVLGQWKVREGDDGITISCDIRCDINQKYFSWNSFNKKVWDEVKRKHPEWRIEKVYSYKYVLSV